ncbi:uncharacterized protein [Panulirus ornatus]|uniref:uncharacterized protein n=1 Tax=Panulirus ornatus TaxID=150431 RepID=UPI003A85FD83
MKVLLTMVLAAVVGGGSSMTVSLDGSDELPPELKPIVPGGSWYDDMAIKRLREKHKELKELGHLHSHEHEDDPEEMFIMARLKNPEIKLLPESIEVSTPIRPAPKTQNTREALRSFLRHHTRHGEHDEDEDNGDGKPRVSVTTSTEFMEVYEKELQKFFKNFMSAMLQAEIGGVSIENHSEEERKDTEVFPINPSGDQANVVVTP